MSAALVLALLGLAGPVDNPAALEAEAAYRANDFARAIEALDRAYAVEPNPRYLFAKGSAYQLLGRCPEALAAYAMYLASDPAPAKARTTAERIRECTGRNAQAPVEPAPKPAPPPVVASPPSAGPIADAAVPTRRRPRERVAPALIGGGIGLGVVAGVLAGVGARLDARAAGRPTEGEFRSDVRDARALGISAIAVGTLATVAVIAGIVRYGVQARRARRVAAVASGFVVRF